MDREESWNPAKQRCKRRSGKCRKRSGLPRLPLKSAEYFVSSSSMATPSTVLFLSPVGSTESRLRRRKLLRCGLNWTKSHSNKCGKMTAIGFAKRSRGTLLKHGLSSIRREWYRRQFAGDEQPCVLR